jgi:outer membrane protein
MRVSRLSSFTARFLAILMSFGLLSDAGLAQSYNYSKGVRAFPNIFAPYEPHSVPEPNFANTGRIDQLMRDGKLMLSLNDAIALALENNLDLAIARYNLPIADTDILRARAGQSTLGVNTGVVQGTPGGGVGSIGTAASGGGAGGTSTGAGGAGAGSSGIVLSTAGAGPSVDSFDPSISSTQSIEHATFPLSNTVTTGVAQLQQNTGTSNYTYTQAFPTGTAYSVGFNNNRQTTNSTRTSLIPVLNSSLRLTLRQHLLSGFGLQPNTRFIHIAKNNREISDISFRQQVMATVTQIENLYWDLVNAYEDLKVKERALGLAQKTESDNRKQVEIGTLAPIEIVRAQAQVASSNQDLIVSQTNLQLQQLLMKNAITRNENDPTLATAEVIPTDSMVIPPTEPIQPIADLVALALQSRPEMATGRIDLVNRDITKKATRSALLPTLDLVGFYGTSALAGDLNPLLAGTGATPFTGNTGFTNALSSVFGGDFPDYQIGFNLTIPIRNRSAQATQVRSELEYRQAQVRIQQLQNQISIEVRNDLFAVQQNRARVDAAQKQRELAVQSLDAENKKYALGASTTFNVLSAQRDLAQAESGLVQANTAYEKSKVALDTATAQTLVRLGIDITDAESGTVRRMPLVPGVVPSSSLPPAPAPAMPGIPQTTAPTTTTPPATPPTTPPPPSGQ